jgi:hypothetical protein
MGKIRALSHTCPFGAILTADTLAKTGARSEISYATEQGFIAEESGIPTQEQGICATKTKCLMDEFLIRSRIEFSERTEDCISIIACSEADAVRKNHDAWFNSKGDASA